MPIGTPDTGEAGQRERACERSHEGFSCESGGGHACRERLPQAGLRGSHRRWAARHSLSGRTQGATARHATTPTPALLLHRAAGAPLEQIHSGLDYRSRVTLAFIGSAGTTHFSRAGILKALSITPFEGSRWRLRGTRRVMEKVGECGLMLSRDELSHIVTRHNEEASQ